MLIFLFKDFLDKLRDCEYVINGPFNAASLQHPASRHFGPTIEEYNTMKLDSIQVVNLRLTTTNFFFDTTSLDHSQTERFYFKEYYSNS